MTDLKNNEEKFNIISYKDLPLKCPMPNIETWSSHPRVFLPIEKEENKTITCPYCSTKYKLL